MSNVDVLEARIASGRVTPSSSAKTCFFSCHALEHGLDHDVGFREAVVVERRLDAGQPLVHLLLRQPALLHGGGVVLADGRQPAVEGFLGRPP